MSETEPVTASAATVQRWRAPDVAAPRSAHAGPLTAGRLADIEEQARADGYRIGLEEGRCDGEHEVRLHAQQLQTLLEAIEPQSAILDDRLLEQIGDLVIAVARQLIRREIKREPGEIVRVIREGLAVLPVSDATIRVFVSPDDAALVRRVLPSDTIERTVKILEDVTLSAGGARVETDVSIVDASIEARLSAIAASVFGDERAIALPAARDNSDG